MTRLIWTFFLALILGLSSPVFASPPAPDDNEACAHMLPKALQTQVLKKHPGYRFLRVDDYSAEDIQSERQYHHGSPCLAAASGDYFGDHRPAYAFILLSQNSDVVVVVAHERSGGPWDVQNLVKLPYAKYLKGAFNYYVNTAPSGSYSDLGLGDDSTEKGDWVKDVTSAAPGVAIGAIESTEDVYFYKDGRWTFTNVED